MLSYHILFYRLFLVFNFVFGVHVCVIAPGGQSMTCKSEFLSSTVCIPWTKLKVSGLAASTFNGNLTAHFSINDLSYQLKLRHSSSF